MAPGSKREKRLAKKVAELEAFQAKKLRQLENPNAFKNISEAFGVRTTKQVSEPPPARHRNMEWTRDHADIDGEWSWGPRSCLVDAWDAELHPFLQEYSRKTWLEIYSERTGGDGGRRQKHISYEINQICEEARDRLINIERDDVDSLFRFRLAGPKRLYGIQQAQVFHVLWWDPEHNIYPVGID